MQEQIINRHRHLAGKVAGIHQQSIDPDLNGIRQKGGRIRGHTIGVITHDVIGRHHERHIAPNGAALRNRSVEPDNRQGREIRDIQIAIGRAEIITKVLTIHAGILTADQMTRLNHDFPFPRICVLLRFKLPA